LRRLRGSDSALACEINSSSRVEFPCRCDRPQAIARLFSGASRHLQRRL